MFNRSTKEKKEKMRSEGILKIDVKTINLREFFEGSIETPLTKTAEAVPFIEVILLPLIEIFPLKFVKVR